MDSTALLEHAKLLQLRSKSHELIDHELRPAQQRVEEAKLKLREAEIAAEQVKLALAALNLQERTAMERFYAAVRAATPQVRTLAERYAGEVSFTFDSNGRSVWVWPCSANPRPECQDEPGRYGVLGLLGRD